jgi:hypothetical protein
MRITTLVLLSILSLFLEACAQPVPSTPTPASNTPAAPAGAEGCALPKLLYQYTPATLQECPNGGTHITAGYLQNDNVIVNPALSVLVCNGVGGADNTVTED